MHAKQHLSNAIDRKYFVKKPLIMRNLEDLEKNALRFWPSNITEIERGLSIIPRLLETQDKFISVLNLADASPTAWKMALQTSETMPANLFLKHLIVLSDVGGERLMRFKKELALILIEQKMTFVWKGKQWDYVFQTLENKKNSQNIPFSPGIIWVRSEIGNNVLPGSLLPKLTNLLPSKRCNPLAVPTHI